MARSIKTSQVMKLVAGENKPGEEPKTTPQDKGTPSPDTNLPTKKSRKKITKNLELDKLIQDSPHNPSLRGIENIETKNGSELTKAAFKSELVDIPAMLIKEQLPIALKRFKVCDCEICKEIMTEKALAELPNRVIKINSNEDMAKVTEALKELEPDLAKILAKLCISSKIKALHNEK